MMLEESCDAIKIISRGGIMRCCGSRTTGLPWGDAPGETGRNAGGRLYNEEKRERITARKVRLRDGYDSHPRDSRAERN